MCYFPKPKMLDLVCTEAEQVLGTLIIRTKSAEVESVLNNKVVKLVQV